MENSRFYGPATKCYYLVKNGHTLNGYYLVKGEDGSNFNKVKISYCGFKQPRVETNQSAKNTINNYITSVTLFCLILILLLNKFL